MADQRPTVGTVFAVLHFIFGGLGVLGGLLAVAGSFLISPIWGIVAIAGLLVSALLIFAGVTLITNKSNAVNINKIYVIASIAYQILSVIMSKAVYKLPISTVAILLGLVYPVLVFILIVNNKAVQDFYK